VEIGVSPKPWRETHRRLLHEALEAAPYFADALNLWTEAVSGSWPYLSPLNFRLTRSLCDYMGIRTPIVMSRQFSATGTKTDRLIDLLRKVGATTYVSGPAAKDYLAEDMFRQHRIGLEYKRYDYLPYPQLWGDFEGTVTTLDLIANCGPDAKERLASLSPNEVAVSV
jgi:hypothetical protein